MIHYFMKSSAKVSDIHLLFVLRRPIVIGEVSKQTGAPPTIRQLSPGAQEFGGHALALCFLAFVRLATLDCLGWCKR